MLIRLRMTLLNIALSEQGKHIIDPLVRLERFMRNYGYWDEEWVADIKDKTASEIETAVEAMESFPAPNVEDLFDHVYAELPASLAAQKESYLAYLGGQ